MRLFIVLFSQFRSDVSCRHDVKFSGPELCRHLVTRGPQARVAYLCRQGRSDLGMLLLARRQEFLALRQLVMWGHVPKSDIHILNDDTCILDVKIKPSPLFMTLFRSTQKHRALGKRHFSQIRGTQTRIKRNPVPTSQQKHILYQHKTRKNPPKKSSAEEAHVHTTTSRQSIREPFI
jgi:hypothetical protein